MNIKTNLGKTFLRLLNIPPKQSSHKVFNRNTVKINYNCMRNMSSVISALKRTVLNLLKTSYGCNSRDNLNCSLQKQCCTES